ncbi:MAG: hypothetical protein QNL47_06000 [Euryarchaeota archaeon]
MTNSQVNWSGLSDSTGTTILNLDANSDMHLHQPSNVAIAQAVMATGATIDEAWDMTIWVLNNNSNGIPNAYVNLTFDQFEPSIDEYTNDLGTLFLPDFISRRWSNVGVSAATVVTIECAYDSISNSTSVTLDSDKIAPCMLPLDNQAPFLIWSTPEDSSVYPSNSEVLFNASDSWDLDDDELIFSWTSDLDGDVLASCTGPGNPFNPNKGFAFTANSNGAWGCSLSDGIHTITLEICDDAGHCVSEQRVIELSNQAPVIVFDVTPAMTPWSELVIPRTQHVRFNLSGTFDPEGDSLICWIERSYQNDGVGQQSGCPTEVWMNLSMAETVPSTFNLEIYAYDGINAPSSYIIPVEIYNEVPEPMFEVQRNGNASQEVVTFDGSTTIDPEGDVLEVEWYSSLDGQLGWSNQANATVWTGHLSRGVHSIEMRVVDDRPEHINATKTTSILVPVDNSPPRAEISTPEPTVTYTSSELIWFSANGSGDYDAACSTFPVNGSWHCAASEPFGGSEYLIVVWSSDLDGRLTPEGEDWLLFDTRLSAGTHTISLSLDDGIHQPVIVNQTIEVTTSAPVLNLVSPVDGEIFRSSDSVFWNAVQSVDYDEDQFTMTVRSDLLNEPLLDGVAPNVTHISNLPAGTHTMEITLTDATGMVSNSFITLTVGQSDPIAVMVSPENRDSIIAGAYVVLSEESTDADDDMVTREWRHWSPNGTYTILSTKSVDEIKFLPGDHKISLYIKDSRDGMDEIFANITVQSSLPRLSDLVYTPSALIAGEVNTLTVSVKMDDADGTTDDVRVTVKSNLQFWEMNLSDPDGDHVWTGSMELNPESSGRPSMKIIATDGDGDEANVEVLSVILNVNEPPNDNRPMLLIGAVLAFISVLTGGAMLVARRRSRLAELDLIDTWDAFGSITPVDATVKDSTVKVEGGAIDGASEVQAEEEGNEEEPQPLKGTDLDWDDV